MGCDKEVCPPVRRSPSHPPYRPGGLGVFWTPPVWCCLVLHALRGRCQAGGFTGRISLKEMYRNRPHYKQTHADGDDDPQFDRIHDLSPVRVVAEVDTERVACVLMQGDSMSPLLQDGDAVMLEFGTPLTPGLHLYEYWGTHHWNNQASCFNWTQAAGGPST